MKNKTVKDIAKTIQTNGDVKTSIDTLCDLLDATWSVEKISKDYIREIIDELEELR